jgi:inositol-pentakisphosphate 2-kinase
LSHTCKVLTPLFRVYFCPLDLLSTDIRDVTRASEVLLQGSKINTFVFAHWLQQTPLLRRLREIQLEKDSNGVLLADTNDENFRVAMTLRDCTFFVRFPIRPRMIDLFEAAIKDPQIPNPNWEDLEIEARLGDLDLKSAEKAEYWESIETSLIDDGWYTGTEKEELRQPVSCFISRVDT